MSATIKQNLGLPEALRFLNATVLSFNMSIGLGASAESTLNVDLIEDCQASGLTIGSNYNDRFNLFRFPTNSGVGMPAYFPDNIHAMPNCTFGGIIHSWEVRQSSSGFTFNVTVKDPRQLLENTLIVTDKIVSGPKYHINYFNVYAYWEQTAVYTADCSLYGLSFVNDNGMPYYRIIETLIAMDINIFPSTYNSSNQNYLYKIDFNTFPGIMPGSRQLPSWYRVPGPGISILQLLEDICNVLAYDFYVYLEKESPTVHRIKIGLVDLNYQPASFSYIVGNLVNQSTEASYGQELRNEKNKSVIVGDSVHYLSPTVAFDHFFGEDIYFNNTTGFSYVVPIIPYGYDDCGFWILKKIDTLNLSLRNPITLYGNGPYQISEIDIRTAMSSYEMWITRALDINTPGSFNAAIRALYPGGITDYNLVNEVFKNLGTSVDNTDAIAKNLPDGMSNPSESNAFRNQPQIVEELKKIHNFVSNLGSTYYGKQYITRLETQTICKKYDPDTDTFTYTDTPTNNGGWFDYASNPNYNVLQLYEPELSHFRNEDGRIKSFAQFKEFYIPTVINSINNDNQTRVGSGVNATPFSRKTGNLTEKIESIGNVSQNPVEGYSDGTQ